jgi:hypothetical protein
MARKGVTAWQSPHDEGYVTFPNGRFGHESNPRFAIGNDGIDKYDLAVMNVNSQCSNQLPDVGISLIHRQFSEGCALSDVYDSFLSRVAIWNLYINHY